MNLGCNRLTMQDNPTFFFKITIGPEIMITSKEMLLLGYKWGTLRISEGKAKAGSGDLITYQIDAEAGNSGGPVFYLDNGVPYAAAIHVADNKQNNYGYRITGEMYSKFMELDDY